jgi:hypothetical protein
MKNPLIHRFAQELEIPIETLSLIQENKYCLIYQATSLGRPCIIKHYKGEDSTLAEEEARALEFYHQVARDDPELIDSGAVLCKAESNLLCIGFVDGQPFSDALYRARRDPALRESAIQIMVILGRLLNRMYAITCIPGAETSPFMFEYFDYCSGNLEAIPFLGRLYFRGMGATAKQLAQALRQSTVVPCFAHGDFVFKNIHVADGRVGLIDFANANPRSHLLNDVYNLHFALNNMVLPEPFKQELLESFHGGLGNLSFPEIAHHFYYEYHRRRWLMLKLISSNPKDVLQGIRGILKFAGPFSPEVMAP